MEFWINPALVTTTRSYLIGDTTSGLRAFWAGSPARATSFCARTA
jgi:hypothetical protein